MAVKDVSIRRTRWGAVGFLVLLGLMICGQGCAEDPLRLSEPQHPPGPPRAAIDACLYKAAAATCYFEGGVHAITGTCQERGRDWVCVPDRAPPDGRPAPGGSRSAGFGVGSAPRPPREAFAACLEQAVGSVCRVRTPRGEIIGRCARESGGLACIPTDPSHRPGEEGGLEFGQR